MPIVDSAAATAQADATTKKRTARETARTTGRATGTEPLSFAAMTGEAEPVQVGRVLLYIKAPTIRDTRKIFPILYRLPDMLVTASLVTPEIGSGIDAEKTAAAWTRKAQAVDPNAKQFTADDVRELAQKLMEVLAFEAEDAEDSPTKAIAEVLALVCDPLPVPVEELRGWVMDTFTLPQIVDILRAVWNVSGGFTGCLRDRFPEPS